MFAVVPPSGPSPSSSHILPAPPPHQQPPPSAFQALSATELGDATSNLTLKDGSPQPIAPAPPAASGSSAASGGAAVKGRGKNAEAKQPRKRGRKRIEEDLDNIKGNDALDVDAKRKLQNRAAQRAFRERKEKHLSDLEARVETQEKQLSEFREVLRSLMAENEALRRGEQPPPIQVPLALLETPSEGAPSGPPSVETSARARSFSGSPVEETKPNIRVSPQTTSPPPPAPAFSLPSAFAHDIAAPPPPAMEQPFPPVQPLTPHAPLLDIDMSALDSLQFDFEEPFEFSDSIMLPPLFDTLSSDPSLALLSLPSTTNPSTSTVDGDADEDDPPPLPNGRIPCDKPQCDFSATSCLLPIPWRPPPASGDDKNWWVAVKCWAKLLSHPLFEQCDSDDLCQELRDRTRCSDDGRLVVAKADVVDLYRRLPEKARLRQQQLAMQ
ncbi:hypothetical protein JCM8547_000321 [Rhodosporidiobolus lusitaniae]